MASSLGRASGLFHSVSSPKPLYLCLGQKKIVQIQKSSTDRLTCPSDEDFLIVKGHGDHISPGPSLEGLPSQRAHGHDEAHHYLRSQDTALPSRKIKQETLEYGQSEGMRESAPCQDHEF